MGSSRSTFENTSQMVALMSSKGPARALAKLLGAQNTDGGWGFHANAESRVEPTAWALLALTSAAADASQNSKDRAARFLIGSQLPDGSWPTAPGFTEGAWVTSVAICALQKASESADAVSRGQQWLVAQAPRDKSLWFRILMRLSKSSKISWQSVSLYGWGWTAGTASWVEPTALACLALQSTNAVSPAAAARLKTAEKMLRDRSSPNGGWGAGNPVVYGVAGAVDIGPTVWALLALRAAGEIAESEKSLAWLEANWNRVPSPSAAALSCLALRAYGRDTSEIQSRLGQFLDDGEISWTIPELAWAAMSLTDLQLWPPTPAQGVR